MADSPFQTAAKATLTAFQTVFGQSVTITRGANSTAGVTALPPDSAIQMLDAQGVRARSVGGEFVVKKADYKISSVAVEPARGDTITWNSIVFDVTEWEDLKDSAQWRISVKEVDA